MTKGKEVKEMLLTVDKMVHDIEHECLSAIALICKKHGVFDLPVFIRIRLMEMIRDCDYHDYLGYM